MSTLNQVIIEGNVVRDATIREKPWGTRFCVVPLAVNRYYKDRQGNFSEETGFYDVHFFGEKMLPELVKNGRKGMPVRVIGRLKQERWKNEDGKQVSKIFVVAQHVDFLKKAKTEKTDEAIESEDRKKALQSLSEAAAGLRSELDDTNGSFDAEDCEDTVF